MPELFWRLCIRYHRGHRFLHTGTLWAAGIFIVASLTDRIDGQIARRYNQVSDFGKLIDPIADKLLTTAAMVVIVAWGKMPSWVAMMFLITRDVVVNSLRVVAAERGFILAAMNSGKIKTVLQLVAYVLYLFEWQLAAHIVMGAACLTTLWSLFEYVGANRSLFGKDRTCTRSFIVGFIDKLVLSYLVFYLTGIGALSAISGHVFYWQRSCNKRIARNLRCRWKNASHSFFWAIKRLFTADYVYPSVVHAEYLDHRADLHYPDGHIVERC